MEVLYDLVQLLHARITLEEFLKSILLSSFPFQGVQHPIGKCLHVALCQIVQVHITHWLLTRDGPLHVELLDVRRYDFGVISQFVFHSTGAGNLYHVV